MSNLEFEIVGPVGGAPQEAPAVAEVPVAATPVTRSYSDSVKERLAALNAGPPPKAAPAAEPAPAPAPAEKAAEVVTETAPEAGTAEVAVGAATEEVDPDLPAEAAAPAAEPAKEPPAPAWEAQKVELEGVVSRQRAAIERLEAEVAKARSAPPRVDDRLKRIADADELYPRDPVTAVRTVLAGILGVDPDSDAAKKEMDALYLDLTSAVAGVTPDPGHRAERTSALTRLEWDRKKQREAGDKTQAGQGSRSEPTAVPTETAVTMVKSGFQPIAEKYPHLTALSQELDGRTPESVLWEVIEKGVQRGDFKADEDDAVLIAKAAALAETHYKGRHDKIRSAVPSTATPGVPKDPPAAAPVTKQERQGTGRTISNADASRAPSTTPPVTSTKDEKPPEFKNDAERRQWALRHLR